MTDRDEDAVLDVVCTYGHPARKANIVALFVSEGVWRAGTVGKGGGYRELAVGRHGLEPRGEQVLAEVFSGAPLQSRKIHETCSAPGCGKSINLSLEKLSPVLDALWQVVKSDGPLPQVELQLVLSAYARHADN